MSTPKLSILVLNDDAPQQVVYGTPYDVRIAIRRADDWAEFDGPTIDGAGGIASTEVMVPTGTIAAIRGIPDSIVPVLLQEIAGAA